MHCIYENFARPGKCSVFLERNYEIKLLLESTYDTTLRMVTEFHWQILHANFKWQQEFIIYTVEPRLSDPRLSVPLIIQNDVQKILKQVIPNC